jgi:hypothetical protein
MKDGHVFIIWVIIGVCGLFFCMWLGIQFQKSRMKDYQIQVSIGTYSIYQNGVLIGTSPVNYYAKTGIDSVILKDNQ